MKRGRHRDDSPDTREHVCPEAAGRGGDPWRGWGEDRGEGGERRARGEKKMRSGSPLGVRGRIEKWKVTGMTNTMTNTMKNRNDNLIAAAPELLAALRCALADLEGIMPELEPSGDRNHPAWTTIIEAQHAIAKAEGSPEIKPK